VPSVVFEAGIGGPQVWGSLVPRVAEFTTAVTYAHAGLGGSEPVTGSRTPEQIVEELHTLLQRAAIPPPYVVVGHSMGGLEARLFAIHRH
jgi:pimeloyl-ACP methyl ester carboxylesterase